MGRSYSPDLRVRIYADIEQGGSRRAAAEDCAKAIERILVEMSAPDMPLMRGWWQSQLVGQLRRYPLIRQRYMPDERIQAALVGVGKAMIKELMAFSGERFQENDA